MHLSPFSKLDTCPLIQLASSDGKCPMVPLSVECSASSECRDQDDCSLGKKCCAFGACGNRCQNPKYASQCVLNGRRYDVGVTFIPDICHVCTCHQEVWLSGKTAVTRCIQMCNTTGKSMTKRGVIAKLFLE